MGSTGEADRKRRQFNSLSPTATSAKKQPFTPLSEDKKLDAVVLKYQNQKLRQKLETQKVEHASLSLKLSSLNKRQQPYVDTLSVVNKSWEELVGDLECRSAQTIESLCRKDAAHSLTAEDSDSSLLKHAFLRRLTETGATESSCTNSCSEQMELDAETVGHKLHKVIGNIVAAIGNLWYFKDHVSSISSKDIPEDGRCCWKISTDLVMEVMNLRSTLWDLHLRHRSLGMEMQHHRDLDAKNKAELKRLQRELESTVKELEDINGKVASLKAERDATKGAFFPVLDVSSKHVSGDRARDKQKDLQDMESMLKELMDEASVRLTELKNLHEERIRILKKLTPMQNTLKNLNCISSSQPYALVHDQLAKSKAEVTQYQAMYEKLQNERDTIAWLEKEVNLKNELVDVSRRSSVFDDQRAAELRIEIQKQIDRRNIINAKLEESSRDPGRKEIIAEFKAMLSSFPKKMSLMQKQLSKHKETTTDVHSLRGDVQALTFVLDRKMQELRTLCATSDVQAAEIQNLQSVLDGLRESESELRLILEMYRRESIEPRDVLEAKDLEYKSWAHVQSLKSLLDEHTLESRVKKANEAEAASQQNLAAAEAKIADMRQKWEAVKRDIRDQSDVLKYKKEENESYISEIESIGQAYDDMQTQNQQLLQQITERDDYNIKLVLEGMRAKHLHDNLFMENRSMERELQQANASLDFFVMKATRVEDQLNLYADQVQKLSEDKQHSSSALSNTQKKLLDVRKSSQLARDSVESLQSRRCSARQHLAELQIDRETERFASKRVEENLEVARRKTSSLQAQIDGSSVLMKLHEEIREYQEILKCSVCRERPKEVVITKCFHLFCHPCIQRIVDSRHRKCPSCSASFGVNDVKAVYI
uniref:E3 ubiquitin protein ligase n=1 Tax=Kalanchoe fedtschenkoi TaxID=63787 RepID=A0A7N0VA89_KALFE